MRRLHGSAAAGRRRGRSVQGVHDSTRSAAGRLGQTLAFFKDLNLDDDERHIAGDLVREVRDRLTFLVDVGLDYLILGPWHADALRRREPANPLGQPDRQRLDRRPLCAGRADDRPASAGQQPLAFGSQAPAGPGQHAWSWSSTTATSSRRPTTSSTSAPARERAEAGSPRREHPTKVKSSDQSLTGAYLSGRAAIPVPADRRPAGWIRAAVRSWSKVRGSTTSGTSTSGSRLGVVTAVTGVSGSGKSSLGGRHPVESGREGLAPRPTDSRRPRGDRGTRPDQQGDQC